MINCHRTWERWGEISSMTRTKTLCGGRGEYWCCLKNCAGQRDSSERTKLSCSSEVWEMILHRADANTVVFVSCSSLNCSSMLPFVLLQDHAALCSQDTVVIWWHHFFWGLCTQPVRGNVLKWGITTSEGLIAELQQRSVLTCSWDSSESCLSPVPLLPEASVSLGCWVQFCWRLARRMCLKCASAFQDVSVN